MNVQIRVKALKGVVSDVQAHTFRYCKHEKKCSKCPLFVEIGEEQKRRVCVDTILADLCDAIDAVKDSMEDNE